MAEFSALMKSTCEFLIANDHAEMFALGVGTLASNRTTNFLAVMLLALFHLLANSLASQVVNSVDFLFSHHLFT